jgi:hypothetical protein
MVEHQVIHDQLASSFEKIRARCLLHYPLDCGVSELARLKLWLSFRLLVHHSFFIPVDRSVGEAQLQPFH